MRADILPDSGAGDIGAGSFRFLHARERKRTYCCQAAGDETGTAQEATTIETSGRLTADRRREITATCLSLCSFDQHGSASLSLDIG
jgi:hypothetical protein